MQKILTFLVLISCVPQGGNVSFGPESQGSLTPDADISSINVSGSQLIINGSNFSGITHVNIKDPATGSVKPFLVTNATFSQLISVSIDAMSLPVNKALELILSNSFGQTTFPITFSLQSNAVATAHIQDGAVTTAKIPNANVTLSKLAPNVGTTPTTGHVVTWGGSGFVLAPGGGGGPGGGISSLTTGEGIVPANPNPITSVGEIAVDVSETGSSTSTKIPYFNNDSELVIDSTTNSNTRLVFSNGPDNFLIRNQGALKISYEDSPSSVRDLMNFIPNLGTSGQVLINSDLYVKGIQVCLLDGTGCPTSATGGVTAVTAVAPITASINANTLTIDANYGTNPNSLVKLGPALGTSTVGTLPAVDGSQLLKVVTSLTAGPAINLSSSSGPVTIGVRFGSGNAQRWQPNLDNLGNLNTNDNFVIIGNGTSFEVQGGDTLLSSIGAQKTNANLNNLASLSPLLGNMILGNGTSWYAPQIPVCGTASGNVVLSDGQIFSCSVNTTPISAGTLTTFNQTALQIRAATTAGTPTGELRFNGSNNTNYVGLKAASGVSSNTIWTLPLTDGTSGYALTTNGAGTLGWTYVGGPNDVTNATPTLDNAVTRFEGTSGKVIQGSGVIIDDLNNISGVANLSSAGTMANTGNFTNSGNMTVDTNTFFVDATNNRIGIITTSPVESLDVRGNARLGSGSSVGNLKFYDTDGSNYVALQATGTVAANVTWTLPGSDGTNGYGLTTNGSGTLSWTAVGGPNDVSNAGPSTSGNLASFSGGTGKVIQDSGIAAANVVTMNLPAVGANKILVSQGANKIAIDTGINVDISNNVTNMGTLNGRTIANWVDGPASATSTNLASFNGASGKLIQDSGLLTANIPTMSSNAGAANRVIASGGINKTLIDSGVSYIDLLTKSSNFSAANRVVLALNGTSRSVAETGYTIPTAVCASGDILKSNGTNLICGADLNSGDVLGPGLSTDNAVARFDGATGKVIQNSGVIIDDSNNISGAVNLTVNGSLTINNNGSNSSTFPSGRGINGQVLTTNGSGALSWTNGGPPAAQIFSIFNPVLTNCNAAGAGANPPTLSANSNGFYCSNGNWILNTYLPNTGYVANGTPIYFKSDASFITNIQTDRTSMGAPLQLGQGNTAVFIYNGATSLYDYVGTIANNATSPALTFNSLGNSYRFPLSRGSDDQVLQTNATGVLSWTSPGGASGIGDVVGPAASTSGNLASYTNATGKLIQDSGIKSTDVVTMTSNPTGTFVLASTAGVKTATASTILLSDLVTNAGASTDNAITRFDGTTGKLIQNSGVILDDSNVITFPSAVGNKISLWGGVVDGSSYGFGVSAGQMNLWTVAADSINFYAGGVNNSGTQYFTASQGNITLQNYANPTIKIKSTNVDADNSGRIIFRESNDAAGFDIVHNTLNSVSDQLSFRRQDGTVHFVISGSPYNGIHLPGANRLEFGYGVAKEINAGMISYGGHTANTLDILGAGATAGNRAIKLWDDVTINDALTVSGPTTLNGFTKGAIRVAKILDYVAGGLPRTGSYTTNGGNLRLDVSGSCIFISEPLASFINVDIDRGAGWQNIGHLRLWANTISIHTTMVPRTFIVTGVAAGYNFQVRLSNGTNCNTDVNDFFDVTVTEY